MSNANRRARRAARLELSALASQSTKQLTELALPRIEAEVRKAEARGRNTAPYTVQNAPERFEGFRPAPPVVQQDYACPRLSYHYTAAAHRAAVEPTRTDPRRPSVHFLAMQQQQAEFARNLYKAEQARRARA